MLIQALLLDAHAVPSTWDALPFFVPSACTAGICIIFQGVIIYSDVRRALNSLWHLLKYLVHFTPH